MKKERVKILLVALINILLAMVVLLTSWRASFHFNEMLGGEPLPLFSEIMIPFSYFWPWIISVISFALFFLAGKLKQSIIQNSSYFLLIADVILLTCTAFAYVWPYFYITYRLSESG